MTAEDVLPSTASSLTCADGSRERGQELLQRLRGDRGDRAAGRAGVLPRRGGRPGGSRTVNTVPSSGTGTRPDAAAWLT